MIDETALKLTLLAAFQHLRSHYEVLSSLGNEIASFRETVAGLDPTFAELLETKRGNSQTVCEELFPNTSHNTTR